MYASSENLSKLSVQKPGSPQKQLAWASKQKQLTERVGSGSLKLVFKKKKEKSIEVQWPRKNAQN